jgi:OmpA-OmpF porin, OOP family
MIGRSARLDVDRARPRSQAACTTAPRVAQLCQDGCAARVALTTFLVLLTLASGCASRRNAALDDARHAYMAAAADPTVARYAPAPLGEARATLDRAEREQRDGNRREVDHLAYVATQEVAKARQVATEKQARQDTRAQAVVRDAQLDAVVAQLAALKARETEQGLVLTVSDVFFEFDRADLKPGAMQELAQVASFVRDHPDRDVVIEGHTDSFGTDAYNADLSQRRAQSVRAFLIAQGVDPSRLVARGFGESFPIASNTDESGRQQNRRVEMLVLNPGQVVTSNTASPVIVR